MKGALRSIVRRWLPCLVILSALAACEDDDGDPLAPFRDALPDEATLALALPDEDGARASGVSLGAALGEPSVLRAHTARARRFVSETLGALLDSYRELVARRPLLRHGDRIVWWQRHPTLDIEHLLVMQREGRGHFTLSAWTRSGHRADRTAPWRFLLYGDLTPSDTLGDGRGALYLDLDNDNRPRTRGKLLVLFSAVDAERAMDVLAFAATADDGLAVTAGYRFREHGGSGSFAFDAGLVDVHARPDRADEERVRVITRWTSDGRFRADFVATSDEVTGDGFRALVGTECWAAGRGVVLFESARALRALGPPVVLRADAGDLSACAAPRPVPPVLPEPTAPPEIPDAPPETGDGTVPEG